LQPVARRLRASHIAFVASCGFVTRASWASIDIVAEPQTNGVAERFNRTMKEQAIHGRIFNNLEEVRAAAVAFKDRYNRDWRLEKLGFKSPLEARQERLMKLAD
jgi:putative transposase